MSVKWSRQFDFIENSTGGSKFFPIFNDILIFIPYNHNKVGVANVLRDID